MSAARVLVILCFGLGAVLTECKPRTPCPPGRVPCPGNVGQCIVESDLCDGIQDCPDGGDEEQCEACRGGAVHCRSSRRCVRGEYKCDATRDCPDGEDERDCEGDTYEYRNVSYNTHTSKYYCGTNVSRWKFTLCDGVRDCEVDDERMAGDKCEFLSPFGDSNCSPGAILCSYEKVTGSEENYRYKCLPMKRVRDGYEDCLQGEDERVNASRPDATPPTTTSTPPTTTSTPPTTTSTPPTTTSTPPTTRSAPPTTTSAPPTTTSTPPTTTSAPPTTTSAPTTIRSIISAILTVIIKNVHLMYLLCLVSSVNFALLLYITLRKCRARPEKNWLGRSRDSLL